MEVRPSFELIFDYFVPKPFLIGAQTSQNHCIKVWESRDSSVKIIIFSLHINTRLTI